MNCIVILDMKERKDRKIIGPCLRTEAAAENQDRGESNCSWCAWNGSKSLGKEAEGIGNSRKQLDHPEQKSPKILKGIMET